MPKKLEKFSAGDMNAKNREGYELNKEAIDTCVSILKQKGYKVERLGSRVIAKNVITSDLEMFSFGEDSTAETMARIQELPDLKKSNGIPPTSGNKGK